MGGGGRHKKKGDQAPKLTLGDEGGIEFKDRGEPRGGEVEEPSPGIHGYQTAGQVGNGPSAKVVFEGVGPTSGAHAPGKPVRA